MPDGTIPLVPKSEDLPKEIVDHVAEFVEGLIASEFTTSGGKPWAERKVAEAIGIAQPTLNKLRNRRGFGVRTLLALRAYTGQTIDAILGYEIPERKVDSAGQIEELQKQIDALASVVAAQSGGRPGPHSKAGKALEELARARRRAAGQRHLDERARAAARPVPRKQIA